MKGTELYCSGIHYLSDTDEYARALRMLKNHLRDAIIPVEAKGVGEAEFLGSLAKRAEGTSRINVHVFSLSEEKNLLSQWRAYCPPTGGFAIGFNSVLLRRAAAREGFLLEKCWYGHPYDTGPSPMFALAVRFLERFRRGEKNLVDAFINQFVRLAPLMKSRAFHEEKEWRLVSPPIDSRNQAYDVRLHNGQLMPFFRLKIEWQGGVSPIGKIVVGPSIDERRASDMAVDLLYRRNPRGYGVEPSHIPYRGW